VAAVSVVAGWGLARAVVSVAVGGGCEMAAASVLVVWASQTAVALVLLGWGSLWAVVPVPPRFVLPMVVAPGLQKVWLALHAHLGGP
jgi:hypothetical protein